MNIYFFPDYTRANPYQHLFYKALQKYGFIARPDFNINDYWIKKNRKKIDILHFHWPEAIWRVKKSFVNRFRLLVGFYRYLMLTRNIGIQIWWTLHNIEPHEAASICDRFGYYLLAKFSDVIICHSKYAANLFKNKFKIRDKIVVMYHGLYENVYPPPKCRAQILSRFNLNPSIPVLGCIGLIRYYKGFDIAVEALKYLNEEVQLIIAGGVHHSYDIANLERIINSVSCKVILIKRFLSDQEFADIMSTCDAILLPYRKITTSGLLLAAWTFEKPTIVTDHPFFREISSDSPEIVEYISPLTPQSCSEAISRFLKKDKAVINKTFSTLKEKYSWNNCVKSLVSALKLD